MAERFLRTLEEQIIYGRVFRTVTEARQAVAEFVERYNRHWRVEKNSFLSPAQMCKAFVLKAAE